MAETVRKPRGGAVTVQDTAPDGRSFGRRLKARRKARHLTLNELSNLSNVSASTISKVENGAVSPTYDVILKLARGLSVPVGDMFGGEDAAAPVGGGPSGWQAIGRKGESERIETGNYVHHYLCSNLKMKSMVPCLVHLKAGSVTAFGALTRHSGEEFIYVLNGRVELHSEFYATAVLEEGDYAYLDSTMGHAYVREGRADATILCICAGQTEGETGI